MIRARAIIPVLIGASLLFACGSDEPAAVDAVDTPAVEAAPPEPEEEAPEEVGSFTLTGYRASFIGSAGYASGVLKFQGKMRKFRVTGLGAGGFGVSKTTASGTVYNMTDINDFTGGYAQARSGITMGDDSYGKKNWVTNENGVKLHVHSTSKGLQLNLGADGMIVSWDN